MSFRAVLVPFIRFFQWSGLSPFPLAMEKSKSFWQSGAFQFTAVTVVNLLINLAACTSNLIRIIYDHQFIMGHSKLFSYTHIIVGFITRIHAITLLIESYSKRSIQMKLFTTFDEIEKIFKEKLNREMDKRQLRIRFSKFIIIWVMKNVAVVVLIILGFIEFTWYTLYVEIITIVPFHTSALFYAQWMMYTDVIRSNIERMNECLAKMSDGKNINRFPMVGQIFQVEASSIRTLDEFDRLIDIQKCFGKIWYASALINRCFRWSLFIGTSTDLYQLVGNLYWILYHMLALNIDSWYRIAFGAVCAGMIATNVIIMSMICEDIKAKVSC